MTNQTLIQPEPVIEAERYELSAERRAALEVTRRQLFGAFGAGLLVICFGEAAGAQESGRGGRRGFGGGSLPQEIGAWVLVAADGRVTGFTGKVEVGQNARTSLTQVIAEELRVPLASVTMVMGDTDLTPFDMGTFGSRTTPTMVPQIRRAAAAARELLLDMAAAQWSVDRAGLTAADGTVTDPRSGRSVTYGQLTQGKRLTKLISSDAPVTPPAAWKVEGHSTAKVNGRDIVTGRHKYTSDIKRPDMLYGRVLRPASFGATCVSLDDSQARKLPGVTVVHEGDFIAVTAPDRHTADRAVEMLKAEWKETPQPSSAELFAYLKQNPEQREGFGGSQADTKGSLAQGMADADVQLNATYTVAYIPHAPLEPRAAVAEWNGDRLTVWTGTQRPFGVKGELASAFNIPEAQVRVIMPDTGAGYGGKHTGECAIEAARMAKVTGKPVKLVWTREEEMTWAYFRPAGVIEVASGAKRDGTLTAWEFHNYNSGGSGIATPYEVPNQHIQFHATKSPLRQGSYRGLAATANHFAREAHMDELARALQMDPVAFRLKNLQDPRMRAVLQAAADRFSWGRRQRLLGHGFGVMCGFEKGGYVACCVEAAVDRATGKVRVADVVEAFDCGAVLNPDLLKNQIEGAVMMALGGALYEHVDFANGKILNPHFAKYRMARFSDLPEIDVVLIDRKDVPSAGAGETPIVGLAPALSNALFDATGVRLRSMPMAPNGLKS